MSEESLDYLDFVKLVLEALEAAGVEYLIGGAVAAWAWGEPRSTARYGRDPSDVGQSNRLWLYSRVDGAKRFELAMARIVKRSSNRMMAKRPGFGVDNLMTG